MRGERGIGGKDGEVDVMDIGEIGLGVDAVFGHEAGQCGAVKFPVAGAKVIGMGAVDIQRLHDPVGHPDLDLVEQAHLRRVERVVEVKDPGADVEEILLWHGGKVVRR